MDSRFKRLIWIGILCMWTLPALGQAETLIRGEVAHGGFGGLVLKLTEMDGEMALLMGGRGGWIINLSDGHAVVLGGGGYGLVSDVRAEGLRSARGRPLYLNLGYGGFSFEYVNRTNRLLHVSAELLIGAGGTNYRDRNYDEFDNAEAFFVLEPGVNGMLNVTPYFRMGAGVSYRLIQGTDLEAFSDTDLSGFSGVLTFKFGRF